MNTLQRVATSGIFISVLVSALAISKPAGAAMDLTTSKLGVGTLPDGCGNPFQDASEFFAFFEETISTIAAKRGPGAKGVADLFAVSELKSELDALLANPQEESAIDRLISSQLCFFQKLQTQAKMSGKSQTNPLAIPTSDDSLHDHLTAVAGKLFRDSRKIVVEVLADHARARQKNNILQAKWAEVRRAREEGRAKIRDLFN